MRVVELLDEAVRTKKKTLEAVYAAVVSAYLASGAGIDSSDSKAEAFMNALADDIAGRAKK